MATIPEITNFVDYYFSPERLLTDTYLFLKVGPDLRVPVDVILRFSRARPLLAQYGRAVFLSSLTACQHIKYVPGQPYVTLALRDSLIRTPILCYKFPDGSKDVPRAREVLGASPACKEVKTVARTLLFYISPAALSGAAGTTIDELAQKLSADLQAAGIAVPNFGYEEQSLRDAYVDYIYDTTAITRDIVASARASFSETQNLFHTGAQAVQPDAASSAAEAQKHGSRRHSGPRGAHELSPYNVQLCSIDGYELAAKEAAARSTGPAPVLTHIYTVEQSLDIVRKVLQARKLSSAGLAAISDLYPNMPADFIAPKPSYSLDTDTAPRQSDRKGRKGSGHGRPAGKGRGRREAGDGKDAREESEEETPVRGPPTITADELSPKTKGKKRQSRGGRKQAAKVGQTGSARASPVNGQPQPAVETPGASGTSTAPTAPAAAAALESTPSEAATAGDGSTVTGVRAPASAERPAPAPPSEGPTGAQKGKE